MTPKVGDWVRYLHPKDYKVSSIEEVYAVFTRQDGKVMTQTFSGVQFYDEAILEIRPPQPGS